MKNFLDFMAYVLGIVGYILMLNISFNLISSPNTIVNLMGIALLAFLLCSVIWFVILRKH